MIVQSCCRGKVLLSFEGVWAANPNTSRDLRWIRSQANDATRSLKVLSVPAGRPSSPVRESRGVINVQLRCLTFVVHIARELANNRAAIRMIMNHERRHLAQWEEAMQAYLVRVGAELDTRFGNQPTLQAIHDDMQNRNANFSGVLRDSVIAWDRRDWPALHNALERVDVPPTLRDSVP